MRRLGCGCGAAGCGRAEQGGCAPVSAAEG